MVKLSTNVFGKDMDVLELGARATDFEDVVEDLVGPDGAFTEKGLHDLITNLRGSQRKKRNTNEEEILSNPTANLYLRSFGKTSHYQTFQGSQRGIVETIKGLPKAFLLGTEQDSSLSFGHSSVFLDGDVLVPTVSGFPLSLSVNGSYNNHFKSKLHWDLTDLFKSGDTKIEVSIYPTATIEIGNFIMFRLIQKSSNVTLCSWNDVC